MKMPEWDAKFERNGQEGRQVDIGKCFRWGNMDFHIPAVHICDEGLIVDMCMEGDRKEMSAFLEKYRDLFDREKNGGKINKRELRKFQFDNPLDRHFRTVVRVNGTDLKYNRGNGMQWIPKDLNPITTDDIDIKPFMEHYGLDKNKIWQFRRETYFWTEDGAPKLEKLELTLSQWPAYIPATVFTIPKVGESVAVIHPRTEEKYILTVTQIEQKIIDRTKDENLIYPNKCLAMEYTMEPEIPRDRLCIVDLAEDDEPIRKEKGVAAGGTIGVIFSNRKDPKKRYAVSSMHFVPVEDVTWQVEFREKTLEDLTVELL